MSRLETITVTDRLSEPRITKKLDNDSASFIQSLTESLTGKILSTSDKHSFLCTIISVFNLTK